MVESTCCSHFTRYYSHKLAFISFYFPVAVLVERSKELAKRSRDFIQVKFDTNILPSFFVPFLLSSSKPSTFTSFVSLLSFFFSFSSYFLFAARGKNFLPRHLPLRAIVWNSESKNKFPRILNVSYSPSFYLHRHFLFIYSSVCKNRAEGKRKWSEPKRFTDTRWV